MNLVKKFNRWQNATYLRGRYAYSGDRLVHGDGYYWYEGYSGINLGDEMIQYAISEMLRPTQNVFLGRFLTISEKLSFLRKSNNPNAIVFGGGTIRPTYCLKHISRLKPVTRLPLHLFGLGLVGYRGNIDGVHSTIKPLWHKLFESTSQGFFGVRGPRSKLVMEDLGKSAVVTGDTAVVLFEKIERQDKCQILVNLGNHDWNQKERVGQFYLHLLEKLLKYGFPILMVPFHRKDIDCHEWLLSRAPKEIIERVESLAHIPSLEQFKALMSNAVFGVGERLHFGIAMVSSGVPTAMLGYLDKHLDFAESINVPEIVFEIGEDSIGGIIELLDAAGERGFTQEHELSERLRQMRSAQISRLNSISQSLICGSNPTL